MTSKDSFDRFVGKAWQYFLIQEESDSYKNWSAAQVLRQLYAYASAPATKAGVKDVLTGEDLYENMSIYMAATKKHKIRLQKSGPWLDIPQDMLDEIIGSYDVLAKGYEPIYDNDDVKLAVKKLPTGYLHVYPPEPMKGNDWRIALNVKPVSMANAVAVYNKLLGEKTDINHVKFLGPGSAGKCDTALFYLKKTGGYDALRDRIIKIASDGNLQLQGAIGGIWEEIKPGIGEASEPPKDYGVYKSFTGYRCIVTYLGFLSYAQFTDERIFSSFESRLGAVMELFGLDIEQPYIQNPIPESLTKKYGSYLKGYLALKKAWA